MPGDPSLKALLAAGAALLAPPAPLPSAPPLLVARLGAASALAPAAWRARPAWSDDSELEQIGDDDPASPHRRERRDELVLLVGRRCLDIVCALQTCLEKEFWPVESRGGRDPKDFLLGTADLRLLRLLVSPSVAAYLRPLVLQYVASLPRRTPADPRLAAALADLLGLIETPVPPAATSAAASASASARAAPIPPTSVTQTVISAHLPPITVAAVVVGWTPTAPPPAFAAVRSGLSRALAVLSPTLAMGILGSALKLVEHGRRTPPRGWTRTWPAYVEPALGALMSAQVVRPGGVRAVMENVFGEAGNMAGPEAIDGPKLDQVSSLLCKVPRTSSPETYYPRLLAALFELVAPESAAHPVVYTHTAAYVVHALWATSPVAVAWLRDKLHRPWLPLNPEMGVVAAPAAVLAAARTLGLLVLHAPPSPAFTDFIVGPVLPPLFALHAALSPRLGGRSIEKQAAAASPLADGVSTILASWGKVVDGKDAVKGIWSIVVGGGGWPPSDKPGLELFWDAAPGGAGASLVFGQLGDGGGGGGDDDDNDDMLPQVDLAPDPAILARTLKLFDRRDVSSEIFLKVLNQWRVLSTAADQDPVQPLLFLQLTLAMMDTLGEKLLSSDPQHVLGFVEGVLNDEVQVLQERRGGGGGSERKRPLIEVVDDGEDEPLPELTEDGVKNMGMVETAISLLLACLEANETLTHATAAILHPIGAHLEALSDLGPAAGVRRLAREAMLVLLVRRSAALGCDGGAGSGGAVSPAVATYRRALALVADALLPVRAHGLVLLRDLVQSPGYDAALTPSVLDVFMQSVQDADSYIYLNAVRGLAAMAEHLGPDVFRTLVRVYRAAGEDVAGDRLEKALRVGEALGMVIRRAGKAFAANAHAIVPVLLATFPNPRLPTILRTSALSLLATCADVDHLALLPWADELASAAVDLVQAESVSSSPFRPRAATGPPPPEARRKVMLVDDEEPEAPEPEGDGAAAPRIVDADPTAQDSKHPALRRAAVVLLGLLTASLIEATDAETGGGAAGSGGGGGGGDGEFKMRLPGDLPQLSLRGRGTPAPAHAAPAVAPATLGRAHTVLRYAAATDVDEVVRGQAGEVVALVERLQQLQQLGRLAGAAGVAPRIRLG